MNDSTWLVSDLHLSEHTPELVQAFLDFLKKRQQDACALYLLGDIFDYWIGDDYHLPRYQHIIQQLRALHQAGIALYFMAGNRDFLVGDAFLQATGCTQLNDPHLITLGDQPALLLHGDTLCTDDVPYQQLRLQLRDPQWQQTFLAKPIEERLHIAQSLRQQSQKATAQKNEIIMDVNQQTVERVMAEHHVQLIIHGHTHRPNRHNWQQNGKTYERIVLGDWGDTLWALQADANGLTLNHWPRV
jgi:UDP-2,3-diacylglucosamine hydrolase